MYLLTNIVIYKQPNKSTKVLILCQFIRLYSQDDSFFRVCSVVLFATFLLSLNFQLNIIFLCLLNVIITRVWSIKGLDVGVDLLSALPEADPLHARTRWRMQWNRYAGNYGRVRQLQPCC